MANVTFTPETLEKVIAAAVAKALALAQADRKDAAIKSAKDGKSERSIKNEIQAVKAFKKAGFGDVKAHDDVKTYNRWLAEGRKVKEGEKAIKVKSLRLFHKSQTEVISSEEKAASVEKMQAAIRAHNDARKTETDAASEAGLS